MGPGHYPAQLSISHLLRTALWLSCSVAMVKRQPLHAGEWAFTIWNARSLRVGLDFNIYLVRFSAHGTSCGGAQAGAQS